MNNKLAYLAALPLMFTLSATTVADSEAAKRDYMQFCASCHGADGVGKGVKEMNSLRPPANLTKLSEANGGIFPYAKVRNVIDGRVDKGHIRVHGTDMPIWGNEFRQMETRAGAQLHAEAVAKMRVLNIVDYIASIQKIDLLKIEKAK